METCSGRSGRRSGRAWGWVHMMNILYGSVKRLRNTARLVGRVKTEFIFPVPKPNAIPLLQVFRVCLFTGKGSDHAAIVHYLN